MRTQAPELLDPGSQDPGPQNLGHQDPGPGTQDPASRSTTQDTEPGTPGMNPSTYYLF